MNTPSPSVRVAGGLTYYEVITGGADPHDTLPLIVALHGLGDTPRTFAAAFALFTAPARVVALQAPDRYGQGYSWFPVRWDDKRVDETKVANVRRAADIIVTSVRAVMAASPTAGKPVVMGFSQGGILAFTLAVEHPDVFGAVIPVSGWLPPALWPKPGSNADTYPPIVAFHGKADPVVPIGPTRAAVTALRERGLRAEFHEYDGVGHTIGPAEFVDLRHALEEASRASSGAGPASGARRAGRTEQTTGRSSSRENEPAAPRAEQRRNQQYAD